MLTYHKTTEEEKYRITAWKYDGDYAVYNSTPYAQQKQTGFGFANPKNHFYSFYDGADLVGFINLGECFIGDIPTFAKTDADEAREEAELMAWVRSLPEPVSGKAHVS